MGGKNENTFGQTKVRFKCVDLQYRTEPRIRNGKTITFSRHSAKFSSSQLPDFAPLKNIRTNIKNIKNVP